MPEPPPATREAPTPPPAQEHIKPPDIILLPEECFEKPDTKGTRIEGLAGCPQAQRAALLQRLLKVAPVGGVPLTSGTDMGRIDKAIGVIADEAVKHGCYQVDVYLPHTDFSPMAVALVKSWMDYVRLDYPKVRIWFKFQPRR